MSAHALPRHDAGAMRPARMLADFLRDGALVVDGFVDPGRCDELVRHARALASAHAGSDRPVFSTRTHAHAAERAFVESAAKVHAFQEEEATDADGRLRVDPARAVNKIGHALHDLHPAFAALSRGPTFERMLRLLGLADPLLIQSMLIYKQPGIGGEVRWHQDATFLNTEPITVTGLWLALEDATLDNGCLWLRPGAHRGPLRALFADTGAGLALETLDEDPWPAGEGMPIEAPAGTLVALHGLAPHRSDWNRSDRSRVAYALHAVDRRARYPASNWLQRPARLPARGYEVRTAMG